MAAQLCLVLGGVRSGKSAFAESRVAALDRPTLYVATGLAIDDEMKERIRRHRESRPSEWSTLEEPSKLAEKLAPLLQEPGGPGAVIVDSVDVWVANLLMEYQGEANSPAASSAASSIEETVLAETEKLLGLVSASSQGFVMVSSEVGLSLVPPEPLGRKFQDILGMVNQKIAAVATEVFLVVAGLPNRIKPARAE